MKKYYKNEILFSIDTQILLKKPLKIEKTR